MVAADLVLGTALMLAGVGLVVVAVFRAFARMWTLGSYEVWALPVAGFLLILLGRWVVA